MKNEKEIKKASEISETIKIKADVFWCQHQKPNEMSGKFQVNLCNLSDIAVTALETIGVTVKVGEDEKAPMGHYITCKSSNPLYVFDGSGMPLTDPVGNGSKGVALVGSYEWKYKNKKGVSPSLKKLIIAELVEYEHLGEISIDDKDIL